jgi:hypothetical protein
VFTDECEDLAYEVAFWVQGLDDADLPLEDHASLVTQLGSHLRSLAIMVLLAFGKTDRFHHNLIRSGRLRRDFLNRCVQLGLCSFPAMRGGRRCRRSSRAPRCMPPRG